MANQKSYWTLSRPQRAKLTVAELTELEDYELMTKGILRPTEPVYLDVPAMPDLPTETWYQVGNGLVFKTLDECEKYIELKPRSSSRNWTYDVEFLDPPSTNSNSIQKVELTTKEAITENDFALNEIKEIKQANENARLAYLKAFENVESELGHMRSDHRECTELAQAARTIVNKWERFKALAGDEATAAKFMLENEESVTVAEAFEFCDMNLPEALTAKESAPSNA